MILSKAQDIADKLIDDLGPFVDQINSVGLVRRKKKTLPRGGIEILCAPNMLSVAQLDAFDKGAGSKVVAQRHMGFVRALDRYVVVGGDVRSGKLIRLAVGGARVTIYCSTLPNYFMALAVTTGSAEWVSANLERSWIGRGLVLTDEGLRYRSDCIRDWDTNKYKKFKCIACEPKKVPAWKSEEEFFEFLGLEWIEPNMRL